MLKIGIIGCGKIAQVRHIPEYRENPYVEIYGYYDVNQERAKALAEKYGGKVYESYQALISEKEIDAVSVLTPNFSHAPISIAALNAGKHVLCEKPMATTLEECVTMVETAQDRNRTLMIAHNQRLAPAHRQAKKLLEQGVIGTLISCRMTFAHSGTESWSVDGAKSWFTDKKQSAFGVLADLGVHKIDLLHYLTGQKAVKVSAAMETLNKTDSEGIPIPVEDTAFCTMYCDGGMMASLYVSWTNYGKEDNSAVLYGTEGVMHLYKEPEHAIIIEKSDEPDQYFEAGGIQTNDNQTDSGIIDMFVEHLRNQEAPYIAAKDVLPAMQTVFACQKSAGAGSQIIEIG